MSVRTLQNWYVLFNAHRDICPALYGDMFVQDDKYNKWCGFINIPLRQVRGFIAETGTFLQQTVVEKVQAGKRYKQEVQIPWRLGKIDGYFKKKRTKFIHAISTLKTTAAPI